MRARAGLKKYREIQPESDLEEYCVGKLGYNKKFRG